MFYCKYCADSLEITKNANIEIEDNFEEEMIEEDGIRHKELIDTIIKSEIEEYNNPDINSKVLGIVGFVDIVKKWNPLIIYQYCEYLYAQCLKRLAQSLVTKKVNCLSGCVQLIKVCKETCGNKILDEFNRLPSENENIFNHIRSYASEDRNHICLMFGLYPYVKTIQSPNAIAYTTVPDNLPALLRQRKRWCVGAMVNDLLLIVNSRHNKWERLNSFANVLVFNINIFIFVSTVQFIMAIIMHPSMLMLYLSIIIIIPLMYSLMIPLIVYNDGKCLVSKIKNVVYYYLGVINYYSTGYILNILIYIYTFYYLDDLNWNAQIINTHKSIDNKNIGNNSVDNICKDNIGKDIIKITEKVKNKSKYNKGNAVVYDNNFIEINDFYIEDDNFDMIDNLSRIDSISSRDKIFTKIIKNNNDDNNLDNLDNLDNKEYKTSKKDISNEFENISNIGIDIDINKDNTLNNTLNNTTDNMSDTGSIASSIINNITNFVTKTVNIFSYFKNKDNDIQDYLEDNYITVIENGDILDRINNLEEINNNNSNSNNDKDKFWNYNKV